MVQPYPRPIIKRKTGGNSKRGKSRIYTDTPEKDRLEELEREKENRYKRKKTTKKESVTRQVFTQQTKNKNEGKKNKKKTVSSSDSESNESIILESDEVSDDFSDVDYSLTDNDELDKNDYVLVKFASKTTIVHYVGIVTEVLNLNEFEIKFLRRKQPGYKFYLPNVEDKSVVDRGDIVLKLPPPNSAKTVRTSSLITFSVNMSSYNVN